MYDLPTGISLFTDTAALLATAVDQSLPEGYESWVGKLRLAAFVLTFSAIALTVFQYTKGDDLRRVAMSAAMVVMLFLTSLILNFYAP